MMAHIYGHFRTIRNYWDAPDWLGRRMLFLSGPRQVGKTTLVTSTLCTESSAYFNWDNRKTRIAFQKDPDFFLGAPGEWICFDEIHKRPKWKDILKGIYDMHKDRYRFVITGSARLDTFKKSGDSLVGRYFHTRLFPINLPDLHKTDFSAPHEASSLVRSAADLDDSPHLETVLTLGGFPEPFFSGSETFRKRWSANHRDLILREDLRDISRIVEVDKVEALLEMLAPAIGNTVSYHNLSRDLEAGHTSVKRWLETLERLQLVFAVSPYSKNIRRAFKQEKNGTSRTGAPPRTRSSKITWPLLSIARGALHGPLWRQDVAALRAHARRNRSGLPFLQRKKPWLLVEAKQGAAQLTAGVYRFSRVLGVPCVVVTRKPGVFKETRGESGQRIFTLSWSRLGRILP